MGFCFQAELSNFVPCTFSEKNHQFLKCLLVLE